MYIAPKSPGITTAVSLHIKANTKKINDIRFFDFAKNITDKSVRSVIKSS